MKFLNRHIVWQFFTRFGAAAFSLFIGVLISRHLGTEGRGTHGLYIASVALIHLSTNWFGGASLVYLSPRHPVPGLIRMSALWTSLFTLLCWLLLYGIGILPQGFEIHLLVSVLLFVWWNNLANILLGKENTGAYNTLMVTHPLFTALVLLAGLNFTGYGFAVFVYGYGVAQFFNLLLAVYYLRHSLSQVERGKDPVLFRVFLKHGFYIQLANLTQFFNYRLLYFLIDARFGKGFLGVYSNALSLAESVWMITRSISTVQFARITNSNDPLKSRELTAKLARVSAALSFACLVVLVFLPDRFFTWLFGPGFEGIHHLLLLLSPGILAMSVSNIYAHFFAGTGQNRVNFFGSLSKLAVVLGAFYLLIPGMEQDAAPLASTLAFCAGFVYHRIAYIRWKRP